MRGSYSRHCDKSADLVTRWLYLITLRCSSRRFPRSRLHQQRTPLSEFVKSRPRFCSWHFECGAASRHRLNSGSEISSVPHIEASETRNTACSCERVSEPPKNGR